MTAAGLLAALLSASAPTGARASAEVAEAEAQWRVGATISVTVEVRHDRALVARLPAQLDLPSALGERRSARRHERRRDATETVDRYHLELVAFEPGLVEIPPIPVALAGEVLNTAPIMVEVESNLSPQEREATSSTAAATLEVLERMAAGDPPPERIQVFDPRPAVGLAALAGLVGLGLVGRRLLRGRRTAKTASVPPPPPHDAARSALDRLAEAGYLDRGETNPYFTELSFVVRRYLGARFGFDALERTVDELLEEVERRRPDGVDRDRLATLLLEAEQAKFARYVPPRDAALAALDEARRLVDATAPRPEPEPREEAPR